MIAIIILQSTDRCQAPNKVVKEWLMKQGYDCIKLEYAFGNSLMDFYMEKGKQKYLMEVKGCTLEIDGVGYFPDAPTERGVKHLRELAAACGQGYKCLIAFVIQMEGISEVRPNTETHQIIRDNTKAGRMPAENRIHLRIRMKNCRINLQDYKGKPQKTRTVSAGRQRTEGQDNMPFVLYSFERITIEYWNLA